MPEKAVRIVIRPNGALEVCDKSPGVLVTVLDYRLSLKEPKIIRSEVETEIVYDGGY